MLFVARFRRFTTRNTERTICPQRRPRRGERVTDVMKSTSAAIRVLYVNRASKEKKKIIKNKLTLSTPNRGDKTLFPFLFFLTRTRRFRHSIQSRVQFIKRFLLYKTPPALLRELPAPKSMHWGKAQLLTSLCFFFNF